MFINGFLANVVSFPTPSTIIEVSRPGYARQPITFAVPANGVTRNAIPFAFGGGMGTLAGRAIFTSAAGSEILFTLPFATPFSFGALTDHGDAGTIGLQFNDLATDPTGAAGLFTYAAGAVLGTCWNDPRDFIGYSPAASQTPFVSNPPPVKVFATAAMTAATALTMKRGLLSASEMA